MKNSHHRLSLSAAKQKMRPKGATSQQKINYLFAAIAGVATAATLFGIAGSFKFLYPDFSRIGLAFLVVIGPLALEAVGAAGLIFHWFDTWVFRPGKVINILQWIAGLLGIAAIFDGVMRLTRRAAWMISGPIPLAVDAILVLLFVLWMVVSYYINKDAKERKVCQFC